jgi:hypothetical protein
MTVDDGLKLKDEMKSEPTLSGVANIGVEHSPFSRFHRILPSANLNPFSAVVG